MSKKRWELPRESTKIIARGTKLSDGKTVGGVGRLADVVVDKIQT